MRVSDWTPEATDVIERTVATVRDRTVEPAEAISRVVVYGLLAALVAVPALVLLTIGAFRGLVLLEQGYTWAAWCTLASSVMENTSLRDPIRSDTFIGPSAGQSGRMLGPTYQEMQDEILALQRFRKPRPENLGNPSKHCV